MSHDVSLAFRQIRRRPGFAFLVILTLGSAIGVNTGLFTVFNTLLFHRLPIPTPERVMHVRNRTPGRPVGISIGEWRYLSQETKSFQTLAAMPWGRSVRLDGREVRLQYVSANFFAMLGSAMARGRGFLPLEDAPDSAGNVVVLSQALWNGAYGADPEIIGRTIRLDDVPFTVIGVTGFSGFSLRATQVWVPLTAQTFWEPDGRRDYLTSAQRCCAEIVGRLAPGIPAARARAEVELLSARFRSPLGLPAETFETTSAASTTVRARRLTRAGFGLLFLAVSLVLLLACANVGNLLLARAYERRPEIAIRLALGAGRGRLVRQLLTESLMLATLAGFVGISVSRVLPELALRGIPEIADWEFPTDHRVLLYTVGLSVLACVAAGLAPALHGTRTARLAWQDTPGAPAPRLRLRSVLLAGQVAISVVLLVGAGLLVRGVRHALTRDLGFVTEDVAVVSFEAPYRPTDAAAVRGFVDQLAPAVEALAGADRLALSPMVPLDATRGRFRLPGDDARQARWVSSQTISSRYFDVLRVPLAAGRQFAPDDKADRVVLVNEALVRAVWPGETAVGRTVVWHGTTREVIGVVRDAHLADLDDIDPTVFSLPETPVLPHVLVRDSGMALPEAVVTVAARIDPRVRATIAPLSSRFDRALRTPRLAASFAGGVGALALLLATLGLFGVCAYSVHQRTREIGIRMAVGAGAAHVIASVFRPASGALLAGLAFGLVGAITGSRLLRHLVFGLSTFDPITYAGVLALLLAAALVATYLPTRRALHIDPSVALRHE